VSRRSQRHRALTAWVFGSAVFDSNLALTSLGHDVNDFGRHLGAQLEHIRPRRNYEANWRLPGGVEVDIADTIGPCGTSLSPSL